MSRGIAVRTNGAAKAGPVVGEHGKAEWGSAKGGAPVWSQDVMLCSLSEWAHLKDSPDYYGHHVSIFANSVVVLSPGRPATR